MLTAVFCKRRTSTRTSNDRGMSYCPSEIEVFDQFTFHKSFLGRKFETTFLVFRRYFNYCTVLSHKITFFYIFFSNQISRHINSHFYTTKFSLTNFLCQMFFNDVNLE